VEKNFYAKKFYATKIFSAKKNLQQKNFSPKKFFHKKFKKNWKKLKKSQNLTKNLVQTSKFKQKNPKICPKNAPLSFLNHIKIHYYYIFLYT
jgi:hypothetical protein